MSTVHPWKGPAQLPEGGFQFVLICMAAAVCPCTVPCLCSSISVPAYLSCCKSSGMAFPCQGKGKVTDYSICSFDM